MRQIRRTIAWWTHRVSVRLHSSSLWRRRTFRRIHDQNLWQSAESASGPGSQLNQTEVVRRAVSPLLRELGVRSLLDAPCGDFHWMSTGELGVDRYVGLDIVEEIIDENRRRYGSAGREFLVRDIVTDPVDRVDLILCRDCLVHLSFHEIRRAVRNFKRSGSEYLLTTTFPGRGKNHDTASGGWRPLDLQAKPFGWPPPLTLIDEGCTEGGGAYADKGLGLWRLADLPD